VDETTAAANARSALGLTSVIAENGDARQVAGVPAPLLPTTDLYSSPPAAAAAVSTAVVQVPAGQQARIGKVLSFNDPRLDAAAAGSINYQANLWNAFRGSIIPPSDNRYAWVPLYRRDMVYYNPLNTGTAQVPGGGLIATPSPFAQVYFIPVAVRNRSTYDASDLTAVTGNLVPRLVLVRIELDPVTSQSFATISGPNVGTVAEGCFLVISDDKIIQPAQAVGYMNGRIFRIGNRRSDLDPSNTEQVWELMPGGDFKADPGPNSRFYSATNNTDTDDIDVIGGDSTAQGSQVRVSDPADAFVIGRNPIGPGQYEGVAQDIAAYVTFVRVN
jgi:hypothetical protein